MSKRISIPLAAAVAAAAALVVASRPANAHFVPVPCDFITGGGFIFSNEGDRVNFGMHGGCKNGAFWGHINFVHRFPSGNYHVDSTEITGYLFDPAFPKARDICGFARSDLGETLRFRVRMEDNREPGQGVDRVGIRLSNGYFLFARPISGGNIQLHEPNPSTFGPSPSPDEATMCGGLAPPE